MTGLRFFLLAAAAIAPTAFVPALHAELPLLQALERERFGNSSQLTIDASTGDEWYVAGRNDHTVASGPYLLSAVGTWDAADTNRFKLNPQYLHLTRVSDRATVSGGVGFDYIEYKSGYSYGYTSCVGPDIQPFECFDTVWQGKRVVRWQRQYSFFLNLNGLIPIAPGTAIVAGVEAYGSPRQGFRYEEEYVDGPPDFSIKYYDYNKGAWAAGANVVMGLWHKALFFSRAWTALLLTEWDFDYRTSLPIYNSEIAALDYADRASADPSVHFVGERSPKHRLHFECSFAESNPERTFLLYAEEPLLNRPLLTVNRCELHGNFIHAQNTCTYLDQWGIGNTAEYGTTFHRYDTSSIGGEGVFELRCGFLRYCYLQATSYNTVAINYNSFTVETFGEVGGGIRIPVRTRLVVDFGCTPVGINLDDDSGRLLTGDILTVHFSVTLVDMQKR